jgi:hypothetical protein
VVRDTEYGAVIAPRTPQLPTTGHAASTTGSDDIRRMNAFRCVQIYCVGIGEARMELLKKIAELTMARLRVGAGDGSK